MQDPDFLNAETLKTVLEKAQIEIENLLEINKLLETLERLRKPATIEILRNRIENSDGVNLNSLLSLIKANEDLIRALFSASYDGNFTLLISLIKCIKDMTILIEEKFTPKSNEYLKETFNFWKNLRI